jgi:hypothetical protein
MQHDNFVIIISIFLPSLEDAVSAEESIRQRAKFEANQVENLGTAITQN